MMEHTHNHHNDGINDDNIQVAIPYTTEDGTAKAGSHFEAVEGELIFENEETE